MKKWTLDTYDLREDGYQAIEDRLNELSASGWIVFSTLLNRDTYVLTSYKEIKEEEK